MPNTQTALIQELDAQRIPLGRASGIATGTERDNSVQRPSWVEGLSSQKISPMTDRIPLGEKGQLLNGPRALPAERMQERAGMINELRGVVLGTMPNSVRCELNTPGGRVEVNLTPELFPNPASFGAIFSLKMDESGGLLRPVVNLLEPSEPDALDRELEQLLEGF